jgi:hypothetical protein
MSYVTSTIELHLEPEHPYVKERCNYLDRVPRGQPFLCVEDLRKLISLPRTAPEKVWLTITTEPLADAVDLRLASAHHPSNSVQYLSVRYPSGRCRPILVWESLRRMVVQVLDAHPGRRVVYAYLEYEE